MTSELSANSNVSASLQRLSQNLRLLLRSLGGEDSDTPEAPEGQGLDEENAGGYAGTEGREDWALERECEIARLETENDELRKLLGIDAATVKAHGINDEDLEQRRAMPQRPQLGSSMGLGGSPGENNWGARSPPPPQTFGVPSVPGNAGSNNGPIGPQPIPLQRTADFQPALRAGTLRRPAMFGQRGRGGGPSMWGPPATQDRQWRDMQGAGGSSLDLGG